MAFRLLALAVPDPVKMEIKISYPERDIMECTLVIIVFIGNAGNIINTRREVVEALSLMVFKSLILCVQIAGLVELRHVSNAFLLSFVEFIFY